MQNACWLSNMSTEAATTTLVSNISHWSDYSIANATYIYLPIRVGTCGWTYSIEYVWLITRTQRSAGWVRVCALCVRHGSRHQLPACACIMREWHLDLSNVGARDRVYACSFVVHIQYARLAFVFSPVFAATSLLGTCRIYKATLLYLVIS